MPFSFRLPSLLAAFGLMLLAGCAPNTVAPTVAPSQPQAQAQAPTPTTPGANNAYLTQPALPQEAKVALLLPLSGQNAAIGRTLMQAAEMGVFDSGDDNFNLVVRDSAAPGGPGLAVSSAMTDGAKLVLGPLFSSEVPDAARAAGSLVPVISFSNDRNAARPGVFVLGIAPQAQVERVVSFAAGQQIKRFAILYPGSAYGNAVKQAYQNAVTQSGGSISVMQGYDPAATDFISTMQALQGSYKNNGFDALMIPEGGQKLRALIAMLPGFDIPTAAAGAGGVRLLGTSLWNDPALTGDHNLSGAWFATTPPDRWASFAQRYQSVYGAPPDPRAGVVYDAVTLAVALAKAKAGGDFSVTRLTDVSGFAGVTGLFRLNPDGTSTRGLSVLEIAPGGINVRDPAPTTFQAAIN